MPPLLFLLCLLAAHFGVVHLCLLLPLVTLSLNKLFIVSDAPVDVLKRDVDFFS